MKMIRQKISKAKEINKTNNKKCKIKYKKGVFSKNKSNSLCDKRFVFT